MKTRTFSAVTTCNAAGYEQYGRHMIASFDAFWPRSVQLHVFVEGFVPDCRSERVVYHDLLARCPGLIAFKQRHRDNPAAHGLLRRRRWSLRADWRKPKVRLRRVDWGFGYDWNAVRFAHKSFAIFEAARSVDADVLFWIDADIRVFAPLPADMLAALMPADCLLSYLARPKFSECGFVGYNLRHPAIADFIAAFESQYADDGLFRLDQYHDSYIFDVVRRRFQRRGCRTHDIAGGIGKTAGHVFVNSVLGQFMDHMKGDRKDCGASRRSDLIAPRPETYWQKVGA